jgi:hypothetical protein
MKVMKVKMKVMKDDAREGFSYHSAKLVLLANGNRYAVDSNTFLQVMKASIHLEYSPVPTLSFFFRHTFVSVVGHNYPYSPN